MPPIDSVKAAPISAATTEIVPPKIEHLCDVHDAEARGGRSRLGGSPLGGGSLFDDFFGRFFEEGASGGAGRGSAGRRSVVPERRAEQVDITQLFSDSTNELLQRAARQAAQWGSMDLNTEHLLHAALEDGVVRRVLEEVDADPDQIQAQLEETTKEARKDATPSLAPDRRGSSPRASGAVPTVCYFSISSRSSIQTSSTSCCRSSTMDA
jgi:ATP-dependent Clp protease ATP-binding subunit ClpC